MEIFQYTFFQNALLGVVIVSVMSAMIGTYIITRRLMFITGGVTHACFGGLGIGYYLGLSPVVMAGIFAVLSSLGVEWLTVKHRVREDSAISVMWALGMAVGTLFIFLTPGYVPELNSFLFGNILTITKGDLLAFAIFTVIFVIFFFSCYRLIVSCAFDRDFARTMGQPVTLINTIMTVAIAVCVVLTIRLIGIMLLMSLLSMPQMVAEVFTNRLKPMIAVSVFVSMVCSVLGLIFSYVLGVPASAMIVLSLVVAYVAARVIKKCNN
ncbi:MAG: metal ABC transporter permease [Muribaculaceae bacterium]|nr:metal ABC transporter permease [Muribaculaceae bacterium]